MLTIPHKVALHRRNLVGGGVEHHDDLDCAIGVQRAAIKQIEYAQAKRGLDNQRGLYPRQIASGDRD
jgi:hypothetical protein